MEQTSDHIRVCYDAVARAYAERFAGELAHKPLDRELLNRFASEVSGRGEIYDLELDAIGRVIAETSVDEFIARYVTSRKKS